MKRVSIDILAVAGATVATFCGAAYFELHETFARWVGAYEHWQLDELPITLLALSLALTWFAFRRWRDARAEIAQRLVAERRISDLAGRNRDLTRELLVAQESERRTLARDLHDELGQTCNAIHVEAAYIANLSAREHGAALASARRIATAVQSLYQLLRDMLHRLRPPALDNLGLVSAIDELCEGWTARTGVPVRFTSEVVPDAIDDAVAIALYRIAQEALTNVARHAGASNVAIRLEYEANGTPGAGDRLVLAIDDDGRGMATDTPSSGLGLLGMQERVAALGGVFAIHTAPGHGLRLRMAVPAQ